MGQEAYVQHHPFERAECLIATGGAFAADADRLNDWVAQATANRMCVYARGQSVPRGVAARAMTLMAQGLIQLRRTRHAPDHPLFDYAALRTALPLEKARLVPISTTLSAEARLLFEVLARMADNGERCPNNDQLAALIGVRSCFVASKHLAKLRQANMIAIESEGDQLCRRIEILDTGAKTGRCL